MPKGGRLWRSKSDFFRPFRTAAASENIVPLYDPELHHQHCDDSNLKDLNVSLAVLIEIFPDVEPEVFRKMLLSISEESRVEVVTEHMLKNNAKSVRGKVRKAARELVSKPKLSGKPPANRPTDTTLTVADTFRSESYKKATKQVFYEEFTSLSHSSIKAVMAEQNYSYTLCRPILQQLGTRSWRFSLPKLWGKRTPSQMATQHPNIVYQTEETAKRTSALSVRRTGDAQLDQELWELFVQPVVAKQRREQLKMDREYASELNEAEAEEMGALFDCDCCYGSVPFEQISTCDGDCHQLCFNCVRRTVNEALYGQGWARAADIEKSSVRCFAPAVNECRGCLSTEQVCHALSDAEGNQDTWSEFQARVTRETLLKSRLRLQRCPFCSYAEADEVPAVTLRSWLGIWHHFATRSSVAVQIMFLSLLAGMVLFTVPLLLLGGIVWILTQVFPPAAAVLDASWSRVHRRRRGLKFTCRSSACGKISCIRCTAGWRDVHTCFETEKTSLRTAIESSATAAIKRTCPKCLLSFVKSSGCNKLVCNCGYTMCYICRQEITSKEGYAHFCQHFRPTGGVCSECERCDLYGDEDEEAAIRRAADSAEKAWKEKEGEKDVDEKATQLMVEALVGQARHGRWYEGWLDAVVDVLAA